MKRRITVIVVALFVNIGLSFGRNGNVTGLPKIPGYRTIVSRFFADYQYTKSYTLLNFAKTSEGWSVYELEFDSNNNYKPVNNQPFWSGRKNKYLKLNYSRSKGNNDDLKQKFLDYNNGNVYEYYRLPYYGYKGWDKDVIKEFEGKSNLDDISLEALARAYSNLAQDALWPQYSYMDESKFKSLKFGDAITNERISFFIENIDKDIDAYWRLYKQNPGFETLVGNIYSKLSAECMYAYSTLYMCNAGAQAKKYLRADLFKTYDIANAKNILNNTARNGILFCNGDMDTYSTWYLQESQSYRRDILIINKSLLGVAFYVNAIRKGFMHQQPVDTRFDSLVLINHYYDYYYTDASRTQAAGKVLDALTGITANNGAFETWYAHPEIAGTVRFSINKINILKDSSLTGYKGTDVDFIEFSIREGGYCDPSFIVFIDILDKNDWRRPVYCSQASDGFFQFDTYEGLEPMVRHLLPYKMDSINKNYSGYFNPDYCYNRYINNMEWPKNDGSGFSYGRFRLTEDMRWLYVLLASEFESTDKTKAKKLIDKVMKMIPVSENTGGYSLSLIAEQSGILDLNDSERKAIMIEAIKGVERKEQWLSKMPEEEVYKILDQDLRQLRENSQWGDINNQLDKMIKKNGHKMAHED